MAGVQVWRLCVALFCIFILSLVIWTSVFYGWAAPLMIFSVSAYLPSHKDSGSSQTGTANCNCQAKEQALTSNFVITSIRHHSNVSNMKLTYLTSLAIAGVLAAATLGTVHASANPCAAKNPCAAAQIDPCAAAKVNPCAAANAVDPCAAAAAADPCAASAEKIAIATSSFETVAKQTVGNISIIQKGGKRYLELDDTFRSANGPDLFVLLHRSSTPKRYSSSDFVSLGRLQSLEGKQVYEIPETVTLEDFSSVAIWCQKFDVTFGKALL